MSDRWVGLAAAAAVVCGLAACGTQVLPEGAAPDSPTDAPVAEVVDSGPDCLADEVIEMLTGLPQDAGRSAPSAGSVPQGFEPVRVVRCTISLTEMLQEPAPPTLVPRLEDVDPGASIPEAPDVGGTDLLQRLTVEEVTLTGDLAPLLDVLSRESAHRSSGACVAMLELQPAIFLVDAAGRAVRPQWPVDGCGFLLEGSHDALALLTDGESTVHEIDQCIGRCSAEDGGEVPRSRS